jgi:hypothetical protein
VGATLSSRPTIRNRSAIPRRFRERRRRPIRSHAQETRDRTETIRAFARCAESGLQSLCSFGSSFVSWEVIVVWVRFGISRGEHNESAYPQAGVFSNVEERAHRTFETGCAVAGIVKGSRPTRMNCWGLQPSRSSRTTEPTGRFFAAGYSAAKERTRRPVSYSRAWLSVRGVRLFFSTRIIFHCSLASRRAPASLETPWA